MESDTGGIETGVDEQVDQEVVDSVDQADSVANQSIRWTASEAVDHERGVWWYIIAVVVVLALAGLSIWQQGIGFASISTIVLIVVLFVAVLTVSRRPARELRYTLDNDGLTIENQLHPYSEFRAFGVHHDIAMWQLVLIPVKRFGMSIEIFINDDNGEAIVDFLGARLPMEDVRANSLDKLVHKLKI
jgi:uncharacterized membrane protein YhaH (DUF805 family)